MEVEGCFWKTLAQMQQIQVQRKENNLENIATNEGGSAKFIRKKQEQKLVQ